MEREPGRVLEHAVNGEQRRADVDCRGSDPQIVGMAPIVKRVTDPPAVVPELGHGGEQLVADGNDGRGPYRPLQSLPSGLTPSGDERAVPKLADGNGREET